MKLLTIIVKYTFSNSWRYFNFSVCDLILVSFFAGLRGSITLINKRNYPAEFSWSPVVNERGTAFSIRPSIGIVFYLQSK